MGVKNIKSKKGIAIIEFLFCFFVFAFTLAVLYGVWGVIHASILNSIGARTYAFSIIRNRSDMRIAKDFGAGAVKGFFNIENRFFAVTTDQPGSDPKWIAPAASIDFVPSNSETISLSSPPPPGFLGLTMNDRKAESQSQWSQGALGVLQPNEKVRNKRTTLVYLKQGYGICLSAECDTLP